jgi:hypothetical protein
MNSLVTPFHDGLSSLILMCVEKYSASMVPFRYVEDQVKLLMKPSRNAGLGPTPRAISPEGSKLAAIISSRWTCSPFFIRQEQCDVGTGTDRIRVVLYWWFRDQMAMIY